MFKTFDKLEQLNSRANFQKDGDNFNQENCQNESAEQDSDVVSKYFLNLEPRNGYMKLD